ncbi:3-methylornithine--L-lysine ligase PylC [Deltaproteobacteria bacterium Smac51]|nr:3-methylornithine--L-lysine ligase PylC [Deltaproteobacteria bacterium Smac51]
MPRPAGRSPSVSFRLGILGGGLQGIEAAYLARQAGWATTMADGRSAPPGSGLADEFIHRRVSGSSDLDAVFKNCDIILPACEDRATLDLLADWSARTGQPVAFDPAAYHISSDKSLSRDLFIRSDTPIPRPWPEAAYPMIAKPANSSGSRGVRLLNDDADFKGLFPDGNVNGWIVEEYCPGPSFSLEVTGRPGAHHSWLTTALEMDEVYDCRQVHAPAGLSDEHEAEFRRISLNIARHLELTGLMDVEIIIAPQGIRVLEIDARLPSQTPIVVYWASGENLLARMLENFITLPPSAPPPIPRAVILEHVHVKGSIIWPGEHIMAEAGPLSLEENFFGADWALTDRRPGRDDWAATLIITAADKPSVLAKRREIVSRLNSLGEP